MKIVIVAVLLISALFAGCLSEKSAPSKKSVVLDLEPANIKIKSGETTQVKIRVNNSGGSSIDALVRFNINSSDKPYVNFSTVSYNLGTLRPGEDSGRRNVDVRASLPAGNNITYAVRAEAIDNINNVILDSKDMIITVEKY